MSAVSDAGRLAGIVRGGALTLGGSLVGRAASMAQSVVVARGLDPHRLGMFAIVNHVLALAAAIVDLGVPVAAMRLVAEYRVTCPAALRRVLRILGVLSVSLAAGAALMLLGASGVLGDVYREAALAPLFRLAAVLLFVTLVGAFFAGVLQGFRLIDTLAAVTPVKAVVALGTTLALLGPLGLFGVIAASIVAEVVTWPAVTRRLRRALAASPSPAAPAALAASPHGVVARSLALSVPVVLNGLVVWGAAWFVRTYVARVAGYESVGYYQVADACARVMLLLPSAVAVPFVPAVSESSALDREVASRMVEGTLRLTLVVVAPAAVVLCLAAEPVLGLLYGAAYGGAAVLTAILVLAAAFQAVGVIVWSTLVGTGRTWTGFGVQTAGQLIGVGLSVAMLPTHGLPGVGGAVLVGSVATTTLGFVAITGAVGVRLTAIRPALAVAVGGWGLAATLWAAGVTGWLPALVVAAGVLALELAQLSAAERGWIATRMRVRAGEARW
jgi:O-antigen/teichoic acid export membrane protein